jgi:hypothetical protein
MSGCAGQIRTDDLRVMSPAEVYRSTPAALAEWTSAPHIPLGCDRSTGLEPHLSILWVCHNIVIMLPSPRARVLFGSDLLPELLALLLGKPNRSFTSKEIRDSLGGPNPDSLYRALNRGMELGVVARSAKGRYGMYAANASSPIYADLRRLLAKLDTRRSLSAYRPLGLRELAELLKATGEYGDDQIPPDSMRLIHQFLDDFEAARRATRRRLLSEPPATGSAILDAYLAALAEHLAASHDLPVPSWVEDQPRFRKPWWFESRSATGVTTALAQSPAAFRRHGLFISEKSLTRA